MSLTSQIRYVKALDNAASDGSGKTGLVYSDITAKYLTLGGTLTSLTTEDITTLGTYQAPTSAAHIRLKELANTDPTKGVYEVHFHNTQLLNTGKKLWLHLSATGAAFQPLEVDLIPYMDTDAALADLFNNSVACIGRGTIDASATTTTLPIKTLNITPGTVDQLIGRVILFPYTGASGLALQASIITDMTISPTVLTVVQLAGSAPAEDAPFIIQ